MKKRFGELDCVIHGGSDRDGAGTGPVIVLLHGYGAPADDLVPLYRVFDVPREARFVFPAAPHSIPGMPFGRAWWHIDMMRLQQQLERGSPSDLFRETPPGMPEARDMVVAALDAIDREMSPSDVVIGGFSQGAMLACDVMLQNPDRFAAGVFFSGAVFGEWKLEAPAAKGPSAAEGKRVLVSHGRQDQVLPFAGGEALRERLVEGGFRVAWVPFNGGHEIPGAALDGASAVITGSLS